MHFMSSDKSTFMDMHMNTEKLLLKWFSGSHTDSLFIPALFLCARSFPKHFFVGTEASDQIVMMDTMVQCFFIYLHRFVSDSVHSEETNQWLLAFSFCIVLLFLLASIDLI